MRKSMLVIALCMLSLVTFGQMIKEKEVPKIIRKALYEKFPGAKEVKWDKEQKNYEASFDVNKVDISMLLNSEGKIVETEVEIQVSQLPKEVVNYLNVHFKNEKIKEVAKITNSKGKITYEIEIKGNDVLFDENGNYISSNKES
ncbi:PepSY-like domain-containing protein [Flavobacterium sp. GT2N3]|uniref:PepSY-like domain-containing protein n=1 Tax=unclassified Flavobacterium TaxID=196869 RepID=UPI003AB0BF92